MVNLCYFCFFRGKIRCLACSLPHGLLVSGDCDSFDFNRRGDHEIVLPDCLRPSVFVESSYDSGVVFSVHFTMHCTVPAPEPQFNCRTLSHRGNYSHYLLHYGLGIISESTKATLNLLPTPFIAFLFCLCLFSHERTWDRRLCVSGTQSSARDSGMLLEGLIW